MDDLAGVTKRMQASASAAPKYSGAKQGHEGFIQAPNYVNYTNQNIDGAGQRVLGAGKALSGQ